MKNRFGFSDVLLMWPITPPPMDVQPEIIRFIPLSVTQGLSNTFTSCIWQNWKGFVWFGICIGFIKYGGFHFIAYQPVAADPTLLYQPFLPMVDWHKSIPNGK